MKELLNIKTVAGAGLGVALGYFAFKSKKPLVLMAFGIGGGILSHHLLKSREEKIVDAESNAKLYLQNINEDITATITSDNSEGDGEKMRFNPEVGYITPYGTVKEDNAGEYMDITM